MLDITYGNFSKSILLLPDFASDVYAYLDRVHIGTSLNSNSVLSEVILKLKTRLPVHHLMCEFEAETVVSIGSGTTQPSESGLDQDDGQ